MPTVSHSWNASLPIRCVGTCPVMQTIGIESHQRVGEARHRIGGAGTGGDQHAADLAGRARIAFGRVHRALLVPHQDVLHLLLREQRVVDRQHRAARIAEQMFHALVGERLDHHFGAGHFRVIVVVLVSPFARRNKKGPRRAMSGRFPAALSGHRGGVRTFTTTVIILRNIVSARTFIARFYKGPYGPGQAHFMSADRSLAAPQAAFRGLFARFPALPTANPSSDCETR